MSIDIYIYIYIVQCESVKVNTMNTINIINTMHNYTHKKTNVPLQHNHEHSNGRPLVSD